MYIGQPVNFNTSAKVVGIGGNAKTGITSISIQFQTSLGKHVTIEILPSDVLGLEEEDECNSNIKHLINGEED